jgi:histidine ammonia-lyase
MMVEHLSASAMAELRNAAEPASLGTAVLSRGMEVDASFASQAVVQTERAVAADRDMRPDLEIARRLLDDLARLV